MTGLGVGGAIPGAEAEGVRNPSLERPFVRSWWAVAVRPAAADPSASSVVKTWPAGKGSLAKTSRPAWRIWPEYSAFDHCLLVDQLAARRVHQDA